VIDGLKVVKEIEKNGSMEGPPSKEIIIVDCGEIKNE
jgi:hypothetical protein